MQVICYELNLILKTADCKIPGKLKVEKQTTDGFFLALSPKTYILGDNENYKRYVKYDEFLSRSFYKDNSTWFFYFEGALKVFLMHWKSATMLIYELCMNPSTPVSKNTTSCNIHAKKIQFVWKRQGVKIA